MIDIELVVKKDIVYKEVAKMTSYVGAKIDEETYERVSTTDENSELLDKYWDETKVACCNSLKEFMKSSKEDTDGVFIIMLSLPNNFKSELKGSMQKGIISYFIASLVAKWFVVTLKDEAPGYATEAAGYLEGVHNSMYERNRPTKMTTH